MAPVTIPNAIVDVLSAKWPVVRRYPTDSLHTNRQLEALGFLFVRRDVRFWGEVLS